LIVDAPGGVDGVQMWLGHGNRLEISVDCGVRTKFSSV
jgi:hypothetical protein